MASIYYQTIRSAFRTKIEDDNYISSFSLSLKTIDRILKDNLKDVDKIKW